MSIVSVICVSTTQIAIRNYLAEEFSIQEAGYWQAVWMISTMYLMVITTALSTYYLPRLSELTDAIEIRKEIISGYKIIIPFVLISASTIFLLKDFIIEVLFTKEFYPMRELFFYQLLGDFLKMCSWTLAFLMIAKGMVKTFIISEISFAVSFYFFTKYFTNSLGFIGVSFAHCINYFFYLILMLCIFKKYLFYKKRNK